MNCAVHTDVPATGFCRNCGKALCPQCTREVRGALYCEDCLAGLLRSSARARTRKGGSESRTRCHAGHHSGAGRRV